MAQSNYNIPNASAPAVRAQLNTVFGSVASNNSGGTEPSTTFSYQWWYDTATDILKMRNAADSGWISIAEFDQGAGEITVTGVSQLTQLQVEDPTSTVFGAVSGQRLAQAIDENRPPPEDLTEQTFAQSTLFTFAHGLAARPSDFKGFIRCHTASDGFSVNDVLVLQLYQDSASNGATMWADATNVYVRVAAFYAVFNSAGGYVGLTNPNFRLFVRVWE